MRELRKVAVFCGASEGNSPEYLSCARELGEELVRRRIGLVYGGGNVGLMGAIAQTVHDGLGPHHVVGIIPKSLAPREVGFKFTILGHFCVDPLFISFHSSKALSKHHVICATCCYTSQISGTTVGEIRLVDDMHSRKAMMFAEADAFIAIPGGFGTLDETIEITTWQQLVSMLFSIDAHG